MIVKKYISFKRLKVKNKTNNQRKSKINNEEEQIILN